MDLDVAEEKMLRAIVQTAVAEAAAGRPFAGEFRCYRISAARLRANGGRVTQVEARISHGAGSVVRMRWRWISATRAELHANRPCRLACHIEAETLGCNLTVAVRAATDLE